MSYIPSKVILEDAFIGIKHSFTGYFHKKIQSISEICTRLFLKSRISQIVALQLALDFENNCLTRASWNRFITDARSAAVKCIRGGREELRSGGTSLTSQ